MREMDVVCRIGGDEFLVLIENAESQRMIEDIVKRLHGKLNKPYSISGLTLSTTASIGVAIFPSDGQTSNQLISKADQALYQAKQRRNAYIMN